MTKIRKYIAIFLTGIFIFPVIFQSVHITWHHSHKHSEHMLLCHSYTNHSTHDKDVTIIVDGKQHCPVCDYKFSINNLPVISVYKSDIPRINTPYIEPKTTKLTSYIVLAKSPRAPPSFFG